ncbi:hypothetical protein AXF42_Ash004054 [Apostasia shenzhenica]|uniref:Transposase-associated domain-containing protein n=1 Tax=Apostasia shenzhenica TaxID=1088818 RepID=A0A2I0A1W6_9ASPA|nr:hypothetical protein AXF42_Ash004054 [Apostasia shenzhenica]
MYNRRTIDRRLTDEFVAGVQQFLDYAFSQTIHVSKNTVRCPCLKCKNMRFHNKDEITVHLWSRGFMPNYHVWTSHGEEPSEEARKLYDYINDGRISLWPGCQRQTKMSAMSELLNLKSETNMSDACFDRMLTIFRNCMPEGANIPKNFYDTKKMIKQMGLPYVKIHACINDCIIYYKEYNDLNSCPLCKHPRYKNCSERRSTMEPFKVLRYLPITPRLQRLYMSSNSAEHMLWHSNMVHPADVEAWKNFNITHPDFACDPRNIRLGLCTD